MKVFIPIPIRIKIGQKTINCVFTGYAHNSSAYRFLVHKYDIRYIHVNTIIELRRVSVDTPICTGQYSWSPVLVMIIEDLL